MHNTFTTNTASVTKTFFIFFFLILDFFVFLPKIIVSCKSFYRELISLSIYGQLTCLKLLSRCIIIPIFNYFISHVNLLSAAFGWQTYSQLCQAYNLCQALANFYLHYCYQVVQSYGYKKNKERNL